MNISINHEVNNWFIAFTELIQSINRFTAVIGFDNIVVVNTDDATLIVPRNKVEKVKDLVGWLGKNNHKEFL